MDPATAVGLALTTVKLTLQAVGYINDVRKAPETRARLAREATTLLTLLTDLRYRLEEVETSADPWFRGVRSLFIQRGPLQLYKEDMEAIAEKLSPRRRLPNFVGLLDWPLVVKDVEALLVRIERLKTLITVALHQDSFTLSLAIKEGITKLNVATEKSQSSHTNIERQRAIAWLSPLSQSFANQQSDTLSKRQPGTGNWVLETPEYRSWLHGEEGILWCYGLPGTGKSVLVSIVNAHLEEHIAQENKTAMAYAYCSYKEQSNQSPVALIGALLQQIIHCRPGSVPSEVMAYYEEAGDIGRRPTLTQVSQLLHSEIQRLDTAYIILDALDECEESTRDTVLIYLMKLLPKIRLLITSRQMPQTGPGLHPVCTLEIRATDSDIRKCIENRLLERRLARHVVGDLGLQDTIITTILGKAKGMILLAQLQMDFLAKKWTKSDLRQAVPMVPNTLDAVYHEAIERIEQQDKEEVELAHKILMWISHSFRPMSVLELRYALAMVPGIQELNEEALPYEDDLVAVCAGLVYIEQKSRTIDLVHHSTTEFFQKFGHEYYPEAHREIADVCLEYMSFIADECYIKGHWKASDGYCNRPRQYTFLQYTAPFWAQHALASQDTDLNFRVMDFIKQKSSFHLLMGELTVDIGTSEPMSILHVAPYDKELYPLLISCGFGLTKIAEYILGQTREWGHSFIGSIEPIHLAAGNGHVETVRLLLEHGAKADPIDRVVERPVALAVRKGFVDVVELLLDYGARPDATGEGVWCSILQLAILHQQEAVVRKLLERKVDVEATDYNERTALGYAASLGHHIIMQLLLDHRANKEAKEDNGMTPLHRAAEGGPLMAVRTLLDSGSDHSATDNMGCTPLHYALSSEIARLLVSKGAVMEARDSYGNTPLLSASKSFREDVILELIRLRADIQARNHESDTVLTVLDRSNLEITIKCILNKMPDSGFDSSGRNALHWAIVLAEICLSQEFSVMPETEQMNSTARIDFRRKYGQDILQEIRNGYSVDSRDNVGNTPLHLAVQRWLLVPKVKQQSTYLLLVKGANPNIKNRDGIAPLHIAVSEAHLEAVRLLIRFGAELDLRDHDGLCALQLAMQCRKVLFTDPQLLRILLEEGADPNVRNQSGRTPLHMAAFESQLEAVEILTEFGADLQSRDDDGHTAVQLAVNSRKPSRTDQKSSLTNAPSSTSAYEFEEDIEKAREQIIELLEARMRSTRKIGKSPLSQLISTQTIQSMKL